MACRKFEVIGFDCDGVMFDTRAANRAYYDQVLGHFNLPLMNQRQFGYVHMHTVDESMVCLFPDAAIRKQALDYRKTMDYDSFLPLIAIEPDLKDLLQCLRGRYKTAIATNRSDTMKPLLQAHGLAGSFDLVVTSRDVDHPKPYPDQLNRIADHFHVLPDRLLYVGDSEVDEAAAKAAGACLVAYRNDQLDAAYHIQRLSELYAIL
jgi:phosphoglycolate phosphatase